MRKKNEFGIPETSEFIEELDDLFCSLVDRASKKSVTRDEQAVIDVYHTIGFVECNGLHQFWGMEAPDRVIESFRIVGALEAGTVLEDSRWIQAVTDRGTDEHGQYDFSPEQGETLSKLEEDLYGLFIGLNTALLSYSKKARILD